jgi:hypothetical protein
MELTQKGNDMFELGKKGHDLAIGPNLDIRKEAR